MDWCYTSLSRFRMKSKLLHIFTVLTVIVSFFGVALPAVAEVVTPTQTPPPSILFDSNELHIILMEMWISPTKVNVGETVTISINATNTAGAYGFCFVDMYINDVKEERRDVFFDDYASEIVTFTTIKNTAGTYNVTFSLISDYFSSPGFMSDTFTVKGSAVPVVPPPAEMGEEPVVPVVPPPVPPPAKTVNWMLIGGIIAAVVIIVGGTIWRVTHRPRAYSLTNTGAP